MIINLSLEDLTRIFDFNYVARGIEYAKNGRVLSSEVHDKNHKINATVQGSGLNKYHCVVTYKEEARYISGTCGCPVTYNCKHVVAVIVDHLEKQHISVSPKNVAPQGNLPLDNWLRSLSRLSTDKSHQKQHKDELHFVLDIKTDLQHGRHLNVSAIKTQRLKSGLWSKGSKLAIDSMTQTSYINQSDMDLLRLIEAVTNRQDTADYHLLGSSAAYVLQKIIATERSHWHALNNPPLQMGETLNAELDWLLQDELVEVKALNHPELILMPLESLMYFDNKKNLIGTLQTTLSVDASYALATAPAIPAEQCKQVKKALKQIFPKSNIAVPNIEIRKVKEKIKPQPCLRVYSVKEDISLPFMMSADYEDYADLHFEYEGIEVSPHATDKVLKRQVDGHIEQITRDFKLEQAWIDSIYKMGLELEDIMEQPSEFMRLYHVDYEHGWLDFSDKDVPTLRAAGWKVTIDPSFRFDVVNVDAWYADLQDNNGGDWFNLELGVKIEEEMISLLPVLVNFIQQQTRAKTLDTFLEQQDDEPFFMTLDDGRVIRVELGKVRHIIETLVELYDPNALDVEGKLRLSRYQANQLNILGETNMQWAGSNAPRLFAEKLAGFKEISSVTVPKTLKASLRPYQQQGLDWLQFLREYKLSGILADEMGLGKTVQTIAHILKEKEEGRMLDPCLVVATTSLMVNWANEVKQFAPSLNVLVSQGDDRKQNFDDLADYDLVLTTYPLLPRDKEVLCAQHWHLVILDEAQHIKNPRSKVAVTARELTSNHRLCLTGTPMENHLGELWSQFHFLMPGLLGDEKQFRNLFRKPIELLADEARQQQLNKRIAPFMLRREKSLVAKELPEKTEIISSVELSGQQRQLYETIRVTMNEKVRQEIDKKGIARSQIIILDALLKLRQVCCDPRLLKFDAAKKVKNSAKLEQLMEILPEMILEGRRILLFSQFTSMLRLIEDELVKRHIDYVKLTGQTKDRTTPINRFQNNDVPLFLISLKAGGTGLNLTAADTVIHYDPWWNPAVEAQATDRAHRIGQKNKVFVYKMIVAGTVEEKINALQQKKKALADALFGGTKQTDTLTEQDIQALFEPLK
jgi:superfamily II DNA or RNA helicase